MKRIKDYTDEELEVMNYDDLAYLILKEQNHKMKINELFKEICDLKKLSEDEFLERIADFFELLTTDKQFIQLEDGYWDIKEKHSERVIIEDEEDEIEEINEENDEEQSDEEEENYYDDDTEEDPDDDLKDLVIIDDEDEENEL